MKKLFFLMPAFFLVTVSRGQTAIDFINSGKLKSSNKDYSGAKADYTQAIELDPQNNVAYNNRGNVYYVQGILDSAMVDYDKSITLNPQYRLAYSNRANLKFKQKNFEGAIEDYNKIIELDPALFVAYNNRGDAKFLLKNYEGAIADFGKAIELEPGNSNVYYSRGDAKKTLKNYDGALTDFNKAIELDQNNQNAYLGRIAIKRELKDDEGAMADCDKVIMLNPKNAMVYNIRAALKTQKKDYDGALEDYNRAIEIDPKYTNGYLNRGKIYNYHKNYDEAIEDFNKVIGLDPKNSEAYVYRGGVFISKGQYNLAIPDFTKAIALNPNEVDNYDLRANAYQLSGMYDKAILDYEAAIQINPDYGAAYTNIIAALVRNAQFDKAKEYYSRFEQRKLSAKNSDIERKAYAFYINAATENIPSGNYDQALSNLKSAANEYGDNSKDLPRPMYGNVLALTSYVLGKQKKLKEAEYGLEQVLAINANQPDVKQSLAAVQTQLTEVSLTDKTPPVIELISPLAARSIDIETNNTKTTIIGRAKDESGISAVKINGIAISNAEKDGLFFKEIELKPGVNEIVVTATDLQGNESNKTFVLTGNLIEKRNIEAVEIAVVAESVQKYYAILIAENEYEDASIADLKNPVNDARELKDILENQYTFNPSNIDTLFNRSREDILQSIIQRCNSLTENDNLLIFFAGHGIAEKDRYENVDGFWIPISAKKGFTGSYISQDDINRALRRSFAKHILLVADACFSGAFTRSLSTDANKYIQQQNKMASRKIIASGNLEPVPDNSLLMYYLKKSLKENKDKYISAKDLFDGFYKAIINNTDNLPQYAAIKNVGDEGGEFVFIRK
jgi:tetratricopeptide (TPR) repeat protein